MYQNTNVKINTSISMPVYSEGWTQPFDHTLNFLQTFDPNPHYQTVTFKIHEGVSLMETGVVAAIHQWQQRTGFPSSHISVDCRNTVEHLPYQNLSNGANMYFFEQAKYYAKTLPVDSSAKKFGLFVGRLNAPRLCIMYDVAKNFAAHSLVSHLEHPQGAGFSTQWHHFPDFVSNTRDTNQWWQQYNLADVEHWYRSAAPKSIDRAKVEDQYNHGNGAAISHSSLIDFYGNFHIDTVVETMVYGNTFWPTEKIARPIAASKPFIVFGAAKFLQRLRCIGFETFGTLWDESYDKLQGLERWQAIRKLVTWMVSLDKKQFEELSASAHQIAAHNYQVLISQFPRHDWQNYHTELKNT